MVFDTEISNFMIYPTRFRLLAIEKWQLSSSGMWSKLNSCSNWGLSFDLLVTLTRDSSGTWGIGLKILEIFRYLNLGEGKTFDFVFLLGLNCVFDEVNIGKLWRGGGGVNEGDDGVGGGNGGEVVGDSGGVEAPSEQTWLSTSVSWFSSSLLEGVTLTSWPTISTLRHSSGLTLLVQSCLLGLLYFFLFPGGGGGREVLLLRTSGMSLCFFFRPLLALSEESWSNSDSS